MVFSSVALVGIGSMAFHGTLLFELQMLDELPMLYTATVLVYIVLENAPERRFGAWLPAALERCRVVGSQPRWHYRMRVVPVIVTESAPSQSPLTLRR